MLTGQQTTRSDGSAAAAVEGIGLSHSYGDVDVLLDVDLHVREGEFLTLLGPSGSGKTTLLRIIAGLEMPRQGRLLLGGREVTRVAPESRGIGVVFQNYALFPHMTVADNIRYPLRMRRVDKKTATARVQEIVRVVQLEGMEHRRPSELSGGQQQRVALARALVFEPKLLLLDEPFGALDRRLREQLGLAVRRVQRDLGVTTIFVTHDQDEAFTMSTRIAVMEAGRILQVDTPQGVYRNPAELRIGHITGQLNLFRVRVEHATGTTLRLQGPNGLAFDVLFEGAAPSRGHEVLCAVRPEHIRISAVQGQECTMQARVIASIHGGGWRRAQLEADGNERIMATLPTEARAYTDGDDVFIGFESGSELLFDASTGLRLSRAMATGGPS